MRNSAVRPKCSVFIAASLDGFIARPDHALDWLDSMQGEGEDYGYTDFMATVDALVIGRNTYDKVLKFTPWPYSGKRCAVLTHRPGPSLHGEEFFSGHVPGLLEQLWEDGCRRIYVDGGKVIQQFLKDGLLDDITLSIVPVVLGDGISLFANGIHERWLELKSSQAFKSGLVQVRYQVKTPGTSSHQPAV